MKNTSPLASYFLIASSLVIAAYLWISTLNYGFPDGYVTEFERAELVLFRTLSLISVFVAGLSTWIALREWNEKTAYLIRYSYFLYLLILAGGYFINHWLRAGLDSGGGG